MSVYWHSFIKCLCFNTVDRVEGRVVKNTRWFCTMLKHTMCNVHHNDDGDTGNGNDNIDDGNDDNHNDDVTTRNSNRNSIPHHWVRVCTSRA